MQYEKKNLHKEKQILYKENIQLRKTTFEVMSESDG